MTDPHDSSKPDASTVDLPTVDLSRTATSLPAGASDVLPDGARLADRFCIDRHVAHGGMGHVYEARDTVLDARVALKTIRPEIAMDPVASRRFKLEVLLARSVSHRNLCTVYDLWDDQQRGISFLTMEFLEGETLSDRLRRTGTLDADERLPLVRQLASGLDAAHRAGIVHRDFKSSNVLVVPGSDGATAVVTDFGLAMNLDDTPGDGRPTRAIVGTPAYMAPEQVRGDVTGPACDLYALGVVMFEMCTGRLPFTGASALDMAHARLTQDAPRPSALADVDEQWEGAILRLLERDPARRFETAGDMVDALEGRTIASHRPSYRLPAERDPFVGRTDERRALAELLESPDGASGPVTLTGSGGMGKTRLARRYGWESLHRWPGGVWFCDLSDATEPDEVVRVVAGAFDVPLGADDPVPLLGRAMAARGRMLVILDNVDGGAGHASEFLAVWRGEARQARFLVTARTPTGADEERVRSVGPLGVDSDAVDLFERRASEHRPFTSSDPTARAVVSRLVERVGGIPLALELAAARLRNLDLTELHRQLMVAPDDAAESAESADIADALERSWSWLEPWEQEALKQVTVFDGGFSMEAAEAVVELPAQTGAPSVLGVVQSLVAKRWLHGSVSLGAPRFGMYTSVREHAADRARRDSTVRAGAVERHGTFYAALGSEPRTTEKDTTAPARWRVLDTEVANFVIACRRAITRGDEEILSATYSAAVSALLRTGPFRLVVDLGRAALEAVSSPGHRAHVAHELARSERLAGDVSASVEHAETARALADDLGDTHLAGRARIALGGLALHEGRPDDGLALVESARELARRAGDRDTEASALAALGTICGAAGRTAEAREHLEAARELYRASGDVAGEAQVATGLGGVCHAQNQIADACTHIERALALYRELGNRRSEAMMMGALCGVHEQGDHELACRHGEDALRRFRAMGDRPREAWMYDTLGTVRIAMNQVDAARESLTRALELHRAHGFEHGAAISVLNLGTCFAMEGREADARASFEAAREAFHRFQDSRLEAIALERLGALGVRGNEVDASRAYLREAMELHRRMGAVPALCGTLHLLEELERAHGNRTAADAAREELAQRMATLSDDEREAVAQLVASNELRRP